MGVVVSLFFLELNIDVLQTISHRKQLQYLRFEVEIAMGNAVMFHHRRMIHSACLIV